MQNAFFVIVGCHKQNLRASLFVGEFFIEFMDEKKRVEIFNQHRSRLFGIAYRMLGVREDAEDILQEAYLRWHKADAEEIRNAEAWLVTIVTRLSIDRLRVAQAEREKYVGPWLPEPIVVDESFTPEEQLEFASDISLAFMALLERLSPTERAAFLLHDIFNCPYSEIARIVGKNEAACRQMIHRARTRVRNEEPRYEANEEERLHLIEKFLAAVNASDEETLLSLFAEDVTLTSDGGGVVPAARKIVLGKRKIARLFYLLRVKLKDRIQFRVAQINGQAGFITYIDEKPFGVATFETDSTQIHAIYNLLNPEKLRSLTDENFFIE